MTWPFAELAAAPTEAVLALAPAVAPALTGPVQLACRVDDATHVVPLRHMLEMHAGWRLPDDPAAAQRYAEACWDYAEQSGGFWLVAAEGGHRRFDGHRPRDKRPRKYRPGPFALPDANGGGLLRCFVQPERLHAHVLKHVLHPAADASAPAGRHTGLNRGEFGRYMHEIWLQEARELQLPEFDRKDALRALRAVRCPYLDASLDWVWDEDAPPAGYHEPWACLAATARATELYLTAIVMAVNEGASRHDAALLVGSARTGWSLDVVGESGLFVGASRVPREDAFSVRTAFFASVAAAWQDRRKEALRRLDDWSAERTASKHGAAPSDQVAIRRPGRVLETA